jgi:hypothetical protein
VSSVAIRCPGLCSRRLLNTQFATLRCPIHAIGGTSALSRPSKISSVHCNDFAGTLPRQQDQTLPRRGQWIAVVALLVKTADQRADFMTVEDTRSTARPRRRIRARNGVVRPKAAVRPPRVCRSVELQPSCRRVVRTIGVRFPQSSSPRCDTDDIDEDPICPPSGHTESHMEGTRCASGEREGEEKREDLVCNCSGLRGPRGLANVSAAGASFGATVEIRSDLNAPRDVAPVSPRQARLAILR